MARDIPKTVEDWGKRVAESGLTGAATIITDIDGKRMSEIVDISSDGGASRTKIPRDLLEHVAELLRERDRLVSASQDASMEALGTPNIDVSLRESCLHLAIEMIRKKYAARLVDQDQKTIEDVSLIPEYLRSKATDIFRIRDELWNGADWWGDESSPTYQEFRQIAQRNPDWPRGKVMNEVLMPLAIRQVSEQLKEVSNG